MPKGELAAKQPPEVSQILRVRLGGQVLLVLMGVQHRSELLEEPVDRTLYRIGAMREEWNDFNHQTNDTPAARLAIHEGPPRIILPNETELETYQRGGEPTLLTRWAKEGDGNNQDIEIISGEPPLGSEVSHLLRRGHPPDAILLHYYIRAYISWASRDPQPDPTEFARMQAEQYESFLSDYPAFEGFDFSLENVGAIHKRYYNWDEWRFDPGAPDFPKQTADAGFAPTLAEARNCYGDHVIQQIAYDCQAARDYHLLTLFERQLKLGRKVFSIFGWPHAHALTPTIEYLQEEVNSPGFWTPENTSSLAKKTAANSVEKHRLQYVLNWDDYVRSEVREFSEIVGDQPEKTVLLDYDFLASLYTQARSEVYLLGKTFNEQHLYQQAAEQLYRYNLNASRLEDSFGQYSLHFVGAVQKVRVDQAAIAEINKHTQRDLPFDGLEYTLPAVRMERFFPQLPASGDFLGLTMPIADIENQTMTASQYVEACMRWISYDANWLPFDSELFTSVQNSPDIINIMDRLDDPKFRKALEQFSHQTIDYYQKTGEQLRFKDGDVVFSHSPNGEYTYRVRNDVGRKDLNPYTSQSFTNYLLTPGPYQNKITHREFLEQCNYKRTMQGLLAAVNSPLYRGRTSPPLWPERSDKVTRMDWMNVFRMTKQLFSDEYHPKDDLFH
jgi:hypothetical protein